MLAFTLAGNRQALCSGMNVPVVGIHKFLVAEGADSTLGDFFGSAKYRKKVKAEKVKGERF